MPTFGKLNEPHRSVPRTKSARAATLAADDKKYFVTLVDLSRTGARLCGPEIPEKGHEVLFRAKGIEVFGKVVWSDASECGVDFTGPISAIEVQRLQA